MTNTHVNSLWQCGFAARRIYFAKEATKSTLKCATWRWNKSSESVLCICKHRGVEVYNQRGCTYVCVYVHLLCITYVHMYVHMYVQSCVQRPKTFARIWVTRIHATLLVWYYCDLQNKWESLRRSSSSRLVQISRWKALKNFQVAVFCGICADFCPGFTLVCIVDNLARFSCLFLYCPVARFLGTENILFYLNTLNTHECRKYTTKHNVDMFQMFFFENGTLMKSSDGSGQPCGLLPDSGVCRAYSYARVHDW